jgi:hypothetical protein
VASYKSGQAISKITQGLVLSAPVIARTIAILTVPLHPQGRKFFHLVTAFANVPGLAWLLNSALN